jgi:hypothetical protein
MLYSLLAAVLILSFLMPVACYLSFVKGYNVNAVKVGERPLDTPKIIHKRAKENAELKTILDNIDAYDGTANGQKEFR